MVRTSCNLEGKALLDYRRAVQVVFQDPYSSLSPRMRVGDIIGEPLEIHTDMSRQAIRERVGEVLELVGLNPDMAGSFPTNSAAGSASVSPLPGPCRPTPGSSCSMSRCRRWTSPSERRLSACWSICSRRLGMSYLFIGHDLATVAHISHRIAVMYLGKIVEVADSQELCANPLHPYTKALFAAALPAHPDDAREDIVLTARSPVPSTRPPDATFIRAAPTPCHAALRKSRCVRKSPHST